MSEVEELIRRSKSAREEENQFPSEYKIQQEKYEGGIQRIIETGKSGVLKVLNLIKNPTGKNNEGFLHGINEAGITPNNIGTFRIFLIVMGILFFSLGEKGAGLLMLATSAGLDWLDGKIAREFDKKSIEGELYDAGIDKVLEIVLSITATIELILNDHKILGVISGILTLIKTGQHFKSQTRKGRPPLKEQLGMFSKAAFRDEEIEFVEKKSDSAANSAGKHKTTFQFGSSIGIFGTSIFLEEYLKSSGMDNIVYGLLLLLSSYSVHLGQKSISGKK